MRLVERDKMQPIPVYVHNKANSRKFTSAMARMYAILFPLESFEMSCICSYISSVVYNAHERSLLPCFLSECT